MACEASGGLLELGHDREPDRALGDPDHEHPQGLVWVLGPSCSGRPSSSNIAVSLEKMSGRWMPWYRHTTSSISAITMRFWWSAGST